MEAVKPARSAYHQRISTSGSIAIDSIRGIILFGLGVFVLYRGWIIHTGQKAWFAYILGFAAIALGIWRLLRRPGKPLVR